MLVGRNRELAQLSDALRSDRPEFIAVFGRRRVGKTHLVQSAFSGIFAFEHAGLANVGRKLQLAEFGRSLRRRFGDAGGAPDDWYDAFDRLATGLESLPDGRKVVFLDELPWMDTPKSNFVSALEHFWNGWANLRGDVVLVVCGSATSWIVDKMINDYGGLHNRLTRRIRLEPFTLGECEEMARAKGLAHSRYQILELYMALGGIPFYWDMLERGESAAQAIDRLYFASDGPLSGEFDRLYASLFRHPEAHFAIVRALGERKSGMTRGELLQTTKRPDNGRFTKALEELRNCGFVRRYEMPGRTEREAVWQLVDNYTLFHFQFESANRKGNPRFWSDSLGSPLHAAWSGIAFERTCLLHVGQIKRALGISGVDAGVYSLRVEPDAIGNPGAQIDLLIDRADNVVNLCEMKFAKDAFAVDADCDRDLRNKISACQRFFGARKSIHATMVATFGIRQGLHSGVVQSIVTLDDLFAP